MTPANVLHPERYHGLPRPRGFEGWYYKLVDADRSRPVAIIPGVFAKSDGTRDGSHCFVQVLDGRDGRYAYARFAMDAWEASTSTMRVRVGESTFGLHGLHLDLDTSLGDIAGDLSFGELAPWPVTVLSPGAMGPFAYLPGMECRHGILSFDHEIRGTLSLGDATIDYTGGRGYIEKDWGRGFPRAWIWMQTNHMGAQESSLSASVALVPYLGRAFSGYLVGLWHHGRLHRFTTYNGARVTALTAVEGNVRWTLERHVRCERCTYRLEIEAHGAPVERAGAQHAVPLLYGPMEGDMLPRVPETLMGRIHVRGTSAPPVAGATDRARIRPYRRSRVTGL
jgi:tocopherol cyclase